MTSLDLISAILDLITTYLFVCANMWMWPMTFFVSILNATLFYKIGLFGDMGLAIGYGLSAIYGWWYWQYGSANHGEVAISTLSRQYIIILGTIALLGTELLVQVLKAHSNVPYLDASTTVLSIIGQWLVCRKKT